MTWKQSRLLFIDEALEQSEIPNVITIEDEENPFTYTDKNVFLYVEEYFNEMEFDALNTFLDSVEQGATPIYRKIALSKMPEPLQELINESKVPFVLI